MKKIWMLLFIFLLLLSACGNNKDKEIIAKINSGIEAFSETENGFIKFNVTTVEEGSPQNITKQSAECTFRKKANRFEYITKQYNYQETGDVFITKLIDGRMRQYLQSEEKQQNNGFTEDMVIPEKTVEDENSMPAIMNLFVSSKPNNNHVERIESIQEGELTGYKVIANNRFLEENTQKMNVGVNAANTAHNALKKSEITYWFNQKSLLVKVSQHTIQETTYAGKETVYDVNMECELVDYNKPEFENFK